MFRGVQYVTMDEKGRLAMPARQREPLLSQCGGQIVVTVDARASCLVIYPRPEWERIERDLQDLPSLDPNITKLKRLLMGHAVDAELDGSGRFLLPAPLRDRAKLGKKLVLVGQGSKLELWAEEQWAAESADIDWSADGLPEDLKSLRL